MCLTSLKAAPLRLPTRADAATLFFLRALTSPGGQRWQCMQSAPFVHPCTRQNHAQGLQVPVPWTSEPDDMLGRREPRGSI
mmetsp:Transcript_32742/g.44298  ORF Transcript_32742/g.44298 Transcript_32742/m.44298 type:complete len:81 (+) Transcript_32742:471-713(+)